LSVVPAAGDATTVMPASQRGTIRPSIEVGFAVKITIAGT
jgi:hypothetical protein